MPTIDSLDIQISSSLKNSDKMLDSLITKCGTLATSLSKIGGTTSKVSSGMTKVSNSTSKATKSTKSLASMYGKFYANFFQVIRGIKQLNESIRSTANYIEAFNYFEVSFNKIASEWKQDYEKFGYDNAEAYAESFTERAKASMQKLSGVQIDVDANGNGLLTETGMKNLGLNIQTITQYASQLASVTNSIGQTGEVSLRTSTAFTKLAGDISSLFNVDYSSVAKNLQSGLIGQSRALYKYGIDITNATLQTYAYGLGLEKAVSEMTQAEKMQLRMIAILDQSKVSWGDLANTINSPSNMIRQFTTNLKEAGMMLGQLFTPLLSKALPIINGVTIAIKRLLANIAGILGIKLDLSSFGQGGADLGEEFDGLEESLDGVAESAKKAKAGLRGFDELKTINMPDGSSSASGLGSTIDLTNEIIKATEEYEKVWREAYDKMEQRAQAFADTIERVFKPVEKLFQDIKMGDWFAVGQDVSNIVSGIFNFFADAIDRVDWYGLGTKIGDFLEGINWTDVLESVGRFIWEGINGALELWEGVFEAAPIETALASLFLMPKLLKLITGSGTASVVKKLATNIYLLVASLMGSQKSIKALTKSYPKFGKAVDVARKAFANFRFGIENGNFLTGMSEGLKTVRNNLTGLQKGLIGISAGFIEFSVIKDSVEDLINGTGSLSANIAELALAVAGAGAAFSLVFGFPAGLVATAIVGLIGAIAGINKAYEEIETQKFGESVKEALLNPGGVPITEVAQTVANSILSIGNSFSSINEKSQELEATEKNIEDVWLEIETIKTKMDAGVVSVEEGTAELTRLFGELAQVAEEKFGKIEEVLVAGFGENGAFGKYANAVGVNVTNSLLTAMGVTADMRDRTSELIALMSDPNISTEKYLEYQQELQGILGTTDEITSVMTDFQNSLSNINLEEIFNEDGTYNAKEFSSALDSVVSSVEETEKQLDQAGKNMLVYLEDLKENAKTAKEKAEIQTLIELVPNAVEESKQLTRQQATLFTAEIQNTLLGGIEKVIDDRAKEWDKKSPFEKWWLSLTQGIDTKTEYIQQGVNKFKTTYADPFSQEIETEIGKLGVEGAGYASDAMKEIIDAMFDVEYYSDGNGEFAITTLNEDWRGVVKGATSGIDKLCEEEGKNVVAGFDKGISDNASSSEKPIKTWMEKVKAKMKEVLDSHSPSRVTQSIGKDTVTGFNQGITKNQSSSINTASTFITNVIKSLSSVKGSSYSIGEQLANGFKNGITSKAQSIYNSVKELANNITKTLKDALDIHSPSRVMFEIGDFTMQGFDEGLERWRNPILESVENFGNQFRLANLDMIQTSYQYPALQYEMSTDYRQMFHDSYLQRANNNTDNMETNTLLRELISAVKDGKVITIDGREVGRTVQKENLEYFHRTGRGLLDV